MNNLELIPKAIHCCWLSGDPLPKLYQDCLDSWKRQMPDFEIVLWDMNKFDVNAVPFVKQACDARKWAFAADYIRLHALYSHGGIYLDFDVMVYRSFEPFLKHDAFSSIEFDPRHFYKYITKGKIKNEHLGLGIEAAVLGAKKNHPWIKDVLDFYAGRDFQNDPDYYWSILLPRVMTKISIEKYGLRLVPIYQQLPLGVVLYPPDVFSSSYDIGLYGQSREDPQWVSRLADNNHIRYAYHICGHSWFESAPPSGWVHSTKMALIHMLGKQRVSRLKTMLGRKTHI